MILKIKDHKYDYEKDDEPSISKLIEDPNWLQKWVKD